MSSFTLAKSKKRIQGMTMNHRDSTPPQAKPCCRLWNHALKHADNLRNEKKERNPQQVKAQCLYTLCLLLANIQGLAPGLITTGWSEQSYAQFSAMLIYPEKRRRGQPPEQESKAASHETAVCKVPCPLSGNGMETWFQCGDPGRT